MREHGQFTDNFRETSASMLRADALVHVRSTESSGLLVGAVGIEPTTFGLKGRCSTTELRP